MRRPRAELLTILLAHSFAPFRFTRGDVEPASWSAPDIGLYAHIPFCRTLCGFCPYYKVAYDAALMKAYMTALPREVDMVVDRMGGRPSCSSLYFGGGSPALALDSIEPFVEAVERRFTVNGPRAIELHPQDVTGETIRRLREFGFGKVSLGVQTFQSAPHETIGRDYIDPVPALRLLAAADFPTIDVDLLFGLPGQTEESLEADFKRAVELGATQISTYPLIAFSYTRTNGTSQSATMKHRLLARLQEIADDLDLERTSIWTFARKGTPGYSSITRNSYIGFGASAATLISDVFKIDTFSVSEYIRSVSENRLPTALTLKMNERTRALFWAFWNSYRMTLRAGEYARLFGRRLESDFGLELGVGRALGFLEKIGDDYRLTERGRRAYHTIEQAYTNEYIDATWSVCRSEAWPAGLELR